MYDSLYYSRIQWNLYCQTVIQVYSTCTLQTLVNHTLMDKQLQCTMHQQDVLSYQTCTFLHTKQVYIHVVLHSLWPLTCKVQTYMYQNSGYGISDAIIITINTGYSLTHQLLDLLLQLEQLFWQLLWTDPAPCTCETDTWLPSDYHHLLPSGRSVAEQWLSPTLPHPPGEREEKKPRKESKWQQ